jgi:hypothetical protein
MYREYPIAMFDYQRVLSIFILCLHSEDIYIYLSLSIDIEAHFQGDFRTRPMDFARCQSLRASPLTPLVEGLLGATRMTFPGKWWIYDRIKVFRIGIRVWEELKILG